jgi:hypothetical protein
MHSIGTVFERVAGSRVFCKLDLSSGFLQVPLEQESCRYTAFSTEDNHYEFLRTPFGLKNSPLHFQRVMNKVLSPVLHKGVEVFVDDNLVHAETEEDLLLLLEQVFKLLAHYGIRLNAKKCAFMVPKVEFLGHDLTANGVSVSPTRLEALRNLPQPQTVRQLRQFMGSFNYIRDYLKDFSIVAQPLFRLISGPGKGNKHRSLVWTQEALTALEQVRKLVDSVPFFKCGGLGLL